MAQDLKKAYRTVMDDHFPSEMSIHFGDQVLVYRKRTWKIPDQKTGDVIEKGLRYGENPGQEAALYELTNGNLVLGDCRFIEPGNGLVSAVSENDMIQSGKHPGKINLTDVDNALGGCALFNRPIDKATAELIADNYLEVVAAPEFEEGSVERLASRANLRIIRVGRMDRLSDFSSMRFLDFKSLIDGGLIVQQSPLNSIKSASDFQPARCEHKRQIYRIDRAPTEEEYADMLFGWQVEQGVTSNSVIYVKDGVTVGIGTGEQDRVGVAEIGIFKAYTKYGDARCFQKHGISYKDLELMVAKGEKAPQLKEEIDRKTREAKGGLIGATMVSDAFFPFRDGVDVAIKEGIRAIVHPGGSLRDFEAIEACNEADPKVTMVFTGQRAFKH